MTASKRVLRILISVNLPMSLKFGFRLDRYVVVAFLLRSCFGGLVTCVWKNAFFPFAYLMSSVQVCQNILNGQFKKKKKVSVKINLNRIAVTFLWPVGPSMGKFFLCA